MTSAIYGSPPVGLGPHPRSLGLKAPTRVARSTRPRQSLHPPRRPPVSSPSARRAPPELLGVARSPGRRAGSTPSVPGGARPAKAGGGCGSRATAQGKAAKRPAERRHGRGDEEAAPRPRPVRVPGPAAAATATAEEVPACRRFPTPSRLLEPSAYKPPGARRDLLCGELLARGLPGAEVLEDHKQDGCPAESSRGWRMAYQRS